MIFAVRLPQTSLRETRSLTVKATSDLLKSGVVSVDIFALSPQTCDRREVVARLARLDRAATVSPGMSVSVDVVVANRGVGHSFPAELRDLFEAWLEFEATDATGKVLIHSGAVSPDGRLEWSAHAYRAVPISDDGQPITRHDIWRTRRRAEGMSLRSRSTTSIDGVSAKRGTR